MPVETPQRIDIPSEWKGTLSKRSEVSAHKLERSGSSTSASSQKSTVVECEGHSDPCRREHQLQGWLSYARGEYCYEVKCGLSSRGGIPVGVNGDRGSMEGIDRGFMIS